MKNLLWFKLLGLAVIAVAITQSCAKDQVPLAPQDQATWTVRPDFATLDTRPPEIIAQFQVTGTDAVPVKLNPLKAAKHEKYALVIGIADYEGTRNDLTYCDDDARDWVSYLQSQGYNVVSLIDLAATASAIEQAVDNLAANSVAGNEIAFCYSGHGSKGNIISTDLYYISSTWLKTKFANAASTKMMFCFDACQIGAMATDLNSSGRIVVVASNKTSYSYDGNPTMNNGIFTYFQMAGFTNPFNYIYLEQDSKYACDQFIAWGKNYRVRVVPSYVDSYPFDFDIGNTGI